MGSKIALRVGLGLSCYFLASFWIPTPAWGEKGRLFARVKFQDGGDALPPGAATAEKLFLVDTGAFGTSMKRAAAQQLGLLDGTGAIVNALKSPDKICIAGADTKIGTVCTANADCNTTGQADGICSDQYRKNTAGFVTNFQLSKSLRFFAKGLKQVDTDGDGKFDTKQDKNDDFIELGTGRVGYPKPASGDYLDGQAFPNNAVGLLGLADFDVKLQIQKTDSGIKFLALAEPLLPGRGEVPLVVRRNERGGLVSIGIANVSLGKASGDFIIVTGSTISLISQKLAEKLGVEPSAKTDLEKDDPATLAVLSSDGFIPSGKPGPLSVVKVPVVEFPSSGGEIIRFKDVSFVVNPESEANILGTDLLYLDDLPTILDTRGARAIFGVSEEKKATLILLIGLAVALIIVLLIFLILRRRRMRT